MTIKQHGGIFGRNPTFNDVEVTGVLTTDGITTSADINFGDNDKAVFGAGSDLQIWHDSNNSIIKDAGTGDLLIQADNLRLGNAAGTEQYILADSNGAVQLRYDGNTKIATTATGVDVTGTVTADGVYLGGTGAANKLDDYEEGTFTPTTASDATGALSAAEGFYTKTGRLVTIQLNVTVSTNFTSNIIGGLPFSVANLASITSVGQNSVVFMLNAAASPVFAGAFEGTSTVYLYLDDSSANHSLNTTQGTYRINLSYIST